MLIGVEARSACASGASLTGVTLSVSALVDVRLPSLMVMTIGGTAPLKLGAGVKVQLPFAATLSVPTPPTMAVLPAAKLLPAEAEGGHGERGPVDVAVVAEHVAGGEAVFGERGAVGQRHRRVVDRQHRDHRAGRRGGAALVVGEVKPIVTLPLKSWLGTNTRFAAWAGVSALPAVTGVMPSAR